MKKTIDFAAANAYEAPCCMSLDLAPAQVICVSDPNGIDDAPSQDYGNY